jgi:hypothetical protein
MDCGGVGLDAPRVAHDLLANGYSIMPDALDPAFCDDEIVAEFGRMRGVWRRALVQSFHGRRTTRYFDLLNAAPIFQAIPIAPRVLGVNVILALSEFTQANGATRLVPGSHAWDHYPEPGVSYESIAAEMPKGGALFTLGSTYHGGGANRTRGQVRHGMTIAYVAGWVRPQENFQAAVTQERAATFDPELQALMGWRLGPTHVGHTYTAEEHLTGPMAAKVALKRDFAL